MKTCNEFGPETKGRIGRLVVIIGQGPSAPKLWTDPEEAGAVRRSNSMIGWGATIVLVVVAFLIGKAL